MKCELLKVILLDERTGKQFSNLVLQFDNGQVCYIQGKIFDLPVHKKDESKDEFANVEKSIEGRKSYAHDNAVRLNTLATIKNRVRKLDGTYEDL